MRSVGEEGTVCLAKNKRNGNIVVIKFTENLLEHEILRSLKGKDHIVELLGILKKVPTPYHCGLIMPKYDCTAELWRGDNIQRCHLMCQLFLAIEECHKLLIVHRDIKPSNILVKTKDGHIHVALADFGLAQYCQEEEELEAQSGTAVYMAPEVLQRKGYNQSVDIWGAAVVLYKIATGRKMLHYRSSKFRILDQIDYMFSHSETKKRKFAAIENSEEREFFAFLLQKEPKNRPTAKKVLKHSYFQHVREEYKICS